MSDPINRTESPELELVKQALKAFANGRLVAIPTETVYGLAAPVNRLDLVQRIFSLKRRPQDHPLIIHVNGITMAQSYGDWSLPYQALAEAFWPGPLTMLVPQTKATPHGVASQSNWVGIRMPDNQLSLKLIRAVGCGLAAPSANLYQKVSPTTAAHVRKYFSEEDVFVLPQLEATYVGIESTIVRITSDATLEILRPGAVTAHQLMTVLPEFRLENFEATNPRLAPGQDQHHYQPLRPLVWDSSRQGVDGRVQKCLKEHGLIWENRIEIVMPRNSDDAARALYTLLHEADREANQTEGSWLLIKLPALATDASQHEQWLGVYDRLTKAASLVV